MSKDKPDPMAKDELYKILEKVALSHGCLDDYGNEWSEQLEAINKAKAAINVYTTNKITERLEEIKKVGLEFDKGFDNTVAYNCLINRIAELRETL